MRELIEALCGDACAGRATGSPGGERARELIRDALRAAGLDPQTHSIPRCGGANLLATIGGDVDRYVLVAAHYDHLGRSGGQIYRGADDNAAAVGVLVEVARKLASARQAGRGVIIAAFDAEEPPHFMSESMGSQHYVRSPNVPLDKIDQMICMDLVGHSLGPPQAPADVRGSLFVLGAERSRGTSALVDAGSRAIPGLVARRLDAEVIPPLSDYLPFWRASVPFLFLTVGRSRYYHTPADTPDKLDQEKIGATAKFLEALVRRCAERDDDARFTNEADDVSSVETIMSLCESLRAISPEAELGAASALSLLQRSRGRAGLSALRDEIRMLIGMLESRLA